ncbi:MAG: chloride channel protein [Candidatus Nanopelagicales bacterium]|nr:chloride channel protein [Candidatus Nanopelagicales bacterium]MDZ4249032.1 chloride channel protein [Candidatus Nanopelagicales bacterium]
MVRRGGVLPSALIAVISLPCGYVVYRVVQAIVGWLWIEGPESWWDGRPPWIYMLALPVAAGALVYLARSRGGDGHNPLFGISMEPVSPRDYPSVLAAIVLSLAGGLVLGPEVAMVSTGSFLGGALGNAWSVPVKRGVMIGAAASLAALLVDPLFSGQLRIQGVYQFSAWDLPMAAGAGVATALLLVVVRLGAIGLLRFRGGDKPRIWQLMVGGLVVGAIAVGYQSASGQKVDLVLTSGETLIAPLVTLGSASLIAWTVLAKCAAYAVSLGSGFRGGPYFPAMFAGAGLGAAGAGALGLSAEPAAIAGVLAGITFLAHAKWSVSLALSLVIAFGLAGPAMVPVALIGGACGRLIPIPIPRPAEPETADAVGAASQD